MLSTYLWTIAMAKVRLQQPLANQQALTFISSRAWWLSSIRNPFGYQEPFLLYPQLSRTASHIWHTADILEACDGWTSPSEHQGRQIRITNISCAFCSLQRWHGVCCWICIVRIRQPMPLRLLSQTNAEISTWILKTVCHILRCSKCKILLRQWS